MTPEIHASLILTCSSFSLKASLKSQTAIHVLSFRFNLLLLAAKSEQSGDIVKSLTLNLKHVKHDAKSQISRRKWQESS